jgi:hypothetical protein
MCADPLRRTLEQHKLPELRREAGAEERDDAEAERGVGRGQQSFGIASVDVQQEDEQAVSTARATVPMLLMATGEADGKSAGR